MRRHGHVAIFKPFPIIYILLIFFIIPGSAFSQNGVGVHLGVLSGKKNTLREEIQRISKNTHSIEIYSFAETENYNEFDAHSLSELTYSDHSTINCKLSCGIYDKNSIAYAISHALEISGECTTGAFGKIVFNGPKRYIFYVMLGGFCFRYNGKNYVFSRDFDFLRYLENGQGHYR